MLEELRNIKISEIEEQIKQINATFTTDDKYNWFEKHIFKKKEYDSYVKEKRRRQTEKIEELYALIEKCKYAKCIQQLGYDLVSAMKALQDRGITPTIVEEEMRETTYMPTKPYVDNMEGIILVHKTNYVPSGNKIKSVNDSEVYENIEHQIAGHKIPMRIKKGRDTVHFAANGEVQEHSEGNSWNAVQYAILVPFKEIPKEQYANVYPNDTYTSGSVELTNECWILVPKGEGEKTRLNNPGVNVIEYDGPNVTGYADKLVRMLGYRTQQIDPGAYGGWRDIQATNSFTEFAAKEGFRSDIHYFSYEQYQEQFSRAMQIIIQYIKYIEMNPEVLTNPQFLTELTEAIKVQLMYSQGTPQNICKDVYIHLINEGYYFPKEIITELGKLDSQNYTIVCHRLSEEITKVIYDNNQQTKKQTQEIKK